MLLLLLVVGYLVQRGFEAKFCFDSAISRQKNPQIVDQDIKIFQRNKQLKKVWGCCFCFQFQGR